MPVRKRSKSMSGGAVITRAAARAAARLGPVAPIAPIAPIVPAMSARAQRVARRADLVGPAAPVVPVGSARAQRAARRANSAPAPAVRAARARRAPAPPIMPPRPPSPPGFSTRRKRKRSVAADPGASLSRPVFRANQRPRGMEARRKERAGLSTAGIRGSNVIRINNNDDGDRNVLWINRDSKRNKVRRREAKRLRALDREQERQRQQQQQDNYNDNDNGGDNDSERTETDEEQEEVILEVDDPNEVVNWGYLVAATGNFSDGRRFLLRTTLSSGSVLYHTIDPANSGVLNVIRRVLMSGDWPKAFVAHTENNNGSDTVFNVSKDDVPQSLAILAMTRVRRGRGRFRPRDNRSVAYLRYLLVNEAKNLDLTRYQLFSTVGPERDSTHCLLHSLRLAGVTEEQLVDVDWKFIGNLSHVSRKSLDRVGSTIARRLKVIPLNVNDHNASGFTRSRTIVYNKKDSSAPILSFGIIHSHLFLDERTKYSGYFIRNMASCRAAAVHLGWTDGREERVCSDPLRRGYKFARPEQCMTSVALLKYLFFTSGQELVKADTSGAYTKKRDIQSKISFLSPEVVSSSQKPFSVSTKAMSALPSYACDIEAAVGGDVHVAILAAAVRLPEQNKMPPASDMSNQAALDFYLTQQFGPRSDVTVRYGLDCLVLLFDTIAEQVIQENGANVDAMDMSDAEEDEVDVKKSRCPRVLCYFHNLRYDSKHLYKSFRMTRLVQKGQTLYSLSFWHRGVVFQCMDSLKVIDMPLSSFQSKLNLPACLVKRDDLISYSFFTTDQVKLGYHSLRTSTHDYVKSNRNLRTPQEQYDFHSRLLDELSSDGSDPYTFDPQALTFNSNLFYAEYLRWDCRVLAAGLVAVHYSMNSVRGLTKPVAVIGKMTLPSIAKTMFWQEGCFQADGTDKPCIAMTGQLRSWLHRAIAGGRVMPSLSCPFGYVEGRFQYLDVCSLYPSSVVRICNELGGFPAGRCELLDKASGQLEPAFLFDSAQVMTFVVRVRITAIRRAQSCGIPALSFMPPAGDCRLYLNAMPDSGEPVETYLGKVGLEDAINIHDIDYEVLEGVYFPTVGGLVSSSYGPTVQSLYDRRAHVERGPDGSVILQVKKTAEGEAIKRLLNSGAYGIFIQKPNDLKVKFMPAEQVKSYVYNQFHSVYRFYQLGRTWGVEEYENDTGAMPCHWGLMVLEMSKRIMNEVLSCLSDIGGRAYYTDTDSVTVADCDVQPLADEFKRRYGRELYGDQLAQMHSDFSLYDHKGKAIPEHDVVSTGFACAGKKSYLHLLEGKDRDGKIHYGYKVSAKGITNAGLLSMAMELCPEDMKDRAVHLQQRAGLQVLFTEVSKVDSQGFSIDLFPPESNRQKFVYTKDSVSTTTGKTFRRVLKNTRRQRMMVLDECEDYDEEENA